MSEQLDMRGLKDYQKFDRLTELRPEFWWNPEMGLQKLERLRFPYFQRSLGDFRGKKVIDIGCGGGILSEDLARAGAIVVAIDPSVRSIEAARRHATEQGLEIDYRAGFAEELEFREDFDVAFCVDVLEHVDDLGKTLDACAQALARGGAFCFLTHNCTPEAFLEIIWHWEYAEKGSIRGSHDFHKFIRPEDLTEQLRLRGIRVVEIKGIQWSEPLDLVEDTSVSYLGYGMKRGA